MDDTRSFFTALDRELDQHATMIRNRVFSLSHDLPWTSEHYRQLQPVIQHELEHFVHSLLKIFDNVGGGKVPDNVLGYQISVIPNVAIDADFLEAGEATDIRYDQRDYADLWSEFLLQKHEASTTQPKAGEGTA
jgi:hypothetical protein